jgi:hypothetical protein
MGSLPQPREMIPCTYHRRAVRILDLDPVLARARPVGRAQPLRRDGGTRKIAVALGVGTGTVQRIKAEVGSRSAMVFATA